MSVIEDGHSLADSGRRPRGVTRPKSGHTPAVYPAPGSSIPPDPSYPKECIAKVPALANTGFTSGIPQRMLIPVAVVFVFAILFVGWEVVERRLIPTISIGMYHALLTIRAGVTTAVAATVVYLLMRRPQQQLSSTAGQLARLLERYDADSPSTDRFENPHLVHCRDVLQCNRCECPMYDSPGMRCWQVVALNQSDENQASPHVTMRQCHECEVYRRSCPDKLTELGESFNNLMFLMKKEARQTGNMRAQLVEKEKMVAVGQMAAGIAHEVCNPLSSISSIVQMLRRAKSSAPKTEELDLIETHIQRISSTVRQLVSLSRPSVEQWELVDIGNTLDDVVQLVTFDRRARQVEVDMEHPEALPRTYALRGQLAQVFINLMLNALDAMPKGGKLRIRAQKRHGNIVVRVEDSGCGIDPGLGRRVFEPFFTTKEPGHGTGLGLAVSCSIVHKHGGAIDFSSAPGKGTVFTVKIPILRKAPDT